MKEVSIIIPVYNVEKYVAECLNSVISQTYDHSKIECIIVDDCTLDRSMDIVNDIIGQYKGDISFIIHRHEKNKGLSASRNTGMKCATGERLYFVDSDDYLYPDSLKYLMEIQNKYPDADFVIGNWYWYDENKECLNYKIDCVKQIPNMNKLLWGDLRKGTAWNFIVRRSLLIDNNICFFEGIYFEDNLFGYQLFPLGEKAILIPEVTYFYRRNQNGIMLSDRNEKVDKVVHDYLLILSHFVKDLDGKAHFGKSIATISLSMYLLDYVFQHRLLISNYEESKHTFHNIRKQYTLFQLKRMRIFLFLLSFILYKPFNILVLFKWFRCNIDKIVSIITFPEPGRW